MQRLGFKGIFCRFCHRMKLADIAAIVHNLAGDNELVLVVNGGLHIVARKGLITLAQKPGVRIGPG